MPITTESPAGAATPLVPRPSQRRTAAPARGPAPAAAPRRFRPRHRGRGRLQVSLLAFVPFAVLIVVKADWIWLHSIAGMGFLAIKLTLALTYRPARATSDQVAELDRAWVTAVIPIYNEDPAMFARGLRSLLGQSRLPDEVHIVDDASATPEGIEAAQALAGEFEARGVVFKVSVQPVNQGKRRALARGFEDAPYSHIYLCMDSDTVLERDALQELLLPLADRKVMATTGTVLALNHDTNLLTRLQDLRYGNSFLFERAAYSRLRAVLCCCGALSAYRGDLVRAYLPDFVTQQFLGRPALVGDDRRMTNYGLLEGQVVFQETSVGYTVVPQRLPHFLRQQVRWNKSFFRESLWALRHQPKRRPAFWLVVLELGLWLALGSAMLYLLLVLPIVNSQGFVARAGDFVIFLVLMAYLRNVRYLDFPRQGMGLVRRGLRYGLAPLHGLMQFTVLLPLRFYALATLARGGWGTRQRGVEVVVGRTGKVTANDQRSGL